MDIGAGRYRNGRDGVGAGSAYVASDDIAAVVQCRAVDDDGLGAIVSEPTIQLTALRHVERPRAVTDRNTKHRRRERSGLPGLRRFRVPARNLDSCRNEVAD